MNNTTDTFEEIAFDAVTIITDAMAVMKALGANAVAEAMSEAAEDLCLRAIALGGV